MGDPGADREPHGHPSAIGPFPAHSAGEPNFEFAFNSRNFSDRVLRIEIIDGPSRIKPGNGDGCGSMSEWKNRKRRREETRMDKDFAVSTTELILNCNRPDLGDGAASGITDGESMEMIEGSPSGDEAAPTNDSPQTMDCSVSLKVRSIYVSSAILAAKSPFFFKLFSSGMKESDHAILRINFSEEAALLDLLSYMYSGRLSATTAPTLLDVLMAADKFEVTSCMRYCSKLLLNLPMTPESALLYLDLPSKVSVASAVLPLTEAAKNFLAARYKDMTKFQDEIMSLPLAGIEAILSSDALEAPSEDVVYDFVLKWARAQYPNIEDRRVILGSHLSCLIRFPYMNCRKLKKVLACNDLDHEVATELVLEALFFKAESLHRQHALALEDSAKHRFTQRAYKYRPLKVIEFEHPHLQCIVFLDLKREELSNLFPLGRVYSQAFHLGGQGFFLSVHCNVDQQSSLHCFGLFLGMQEKGVVSLTVDYEFSARTRPSGEFVSKYKGCYTFTGGKAVGYRNLFGIPWASFLADDSLYLINDMLHLKAELTIKQPQLQPQPPP